MCGGRDLHYFLHEVLREGFQRLLNVNAHRIRSKRELKKFAMEHKREQNQSSPSLDQPKALQKCISVFENAKNDNERFAGLLLVTQLIRSDTLDRAERRKLFDAVGFTFINRLLTTTEVPHGCPENVFKSLALTILACFATDTELLFHPQMVAKIPVIGELISGTAGEILDDCYQILMSFASSVKGCAHLIRMESTGVLCRNVEERSCSTALEILLRMLHFCPVETWQNGGSDLVRVLPSLCKKFRDAQDASKFEMCTSLVSFLSGVDSSSLGRLLVETEVGNDWQTDLSKGLQEILQSKISSEQRDPALILTALLIDLIGMKWMLTHQALNPPTRTAAEEVNAPELFIIALSLASVEIRMILENSASKEEIITKRSLLSACYDIVERTINFTASEASIGEDKGDYTTLSKNTVSRVYSLVKEAVQSIMGFLDRASHHQQDISNFSDDERHVLIASVRVVGAWIAEETSALQAEVHKLLPFLLKLGKDALESDVSVKAASTNKHQTTAEGGIGLAGDLSDLQLSEDEATCSQPIILQFLLPGLCHLSADESALKVLIENQAHALLGKYFFSEWKKWMNEMEDSDAKTTLTTLIGIFLNFAVMKPDLVRKDEVFKDLCQQVISSVPDLILHPEHVFLLSNLVVLGLMLVRHQHVLQTPGQKPESDMEPFFMSALQLLRSGIQLKLGNEEGLAHRPSQLALACKQHWDDISELWFLGLQVFTSLLSLSPVLRAVVKESGWCEEIETCNSTTNQALEETRKALQSFLKEFQRLQV